MNPFGYHPIPKNTHKHKKHSTDFSPATRKAILERDKCCIRCGRKGEAIHHIRFRSEHTSDVNHKRNGVLICSSCHSWAHSCKEGRQYFVDWKETLLGPNGDYIF